MLKEIDSYKNLGGHLVHKVWDLRLSNNHF
jgi:hypothetical protein